MKPKEWDNLKIGDKFQLYDISQDYSWVIKSSQNINPSYPDLGPCYQVLTLYKGKERKESEQLLIPAYRSNYTIYKLINQQQTKTSQGYLINEDGTLKNPTPGFEFL